MSSQAKSSLRAQYRPAARNQDKSFSIRSTITTRSTARSLTNRAKPDYRQVRSIHDNPVRIPVETLKRMARLDREEEVYKRMDAVQLPAETHTTTNTQTLPNLGEAPALYQRRLTCNTILVPSRIALERLQ